MPSMRRRTNCCLLASIAPMSTWRRASTRFGERIGPFYVAPEELADVPRTPRRPLIDRGDIGVFKVVVAGTLGAIAAGATLFLMMMQSGAGNGEIAVAATLVGIVTAGAGFLLARRIFGGDEAQGLDALMAKRGLILWARARSPEQEALAQEILLAHGARAVRVHEIDLEKRPERSSFGLDSTGSVARQRAARTPIGSPAAQPHGGRPRARRVSLLDSAYDHPVA